MPETSRHAAVREPRNLPAEAGAQEGEGKSCRGNLMFSVLLAAYIHMYYCAHVGQFTSSLGCLPAVTLHELPSVTSVSSL